MKIKVRLLADVEDVGKLGQIVEIEEDSFDEDLHSKELEKDKQQIGKVLEADDIANAVVYAITQPEHVSINEVLVRPTRQQG